MRSLRIAGAAAALIAAFPTPQAASAADAGGYLVSSNGRAVIDPFGRCWHTGEWRPGMRFQSCQPRLASAAAPAKAPPAAPRVLARETAPAPKPPVPLRLSADTLFAFDSAELSERGRAALDSLDKRIAAADYRRVDIAGHADPLGAASYNRRLSERRADSVRDYLARHGIDAHRMVAEGLGSADPVTREAQCKDLPRGALIRCLQPDRYAQVTVLGALHTASAQ